MSKRRLGPVGALAFVVFVGLWIRGCEGEIKNKNNLQLVRTEGLDSGAPQAKVLAVMGRPDKVIYYGQDSRIDLYGVAPLAPGEEYDLWDTGNDRYEGVKVGTDRRTAGIVKLTETVAMPGDR